MTQMLQRYLSGLCFVLWSAGTGADMAATEAKQSRCFGTTSNGRLENGVQLPYRGDNFVAYSKLGHWLGRNYVHSEVRAIVIDSLNQLHQQYPGKKFRYGETSLRKGGLMKPHRTHQNGLSVDFMVPVLDDEGKSAYFPSNMSNKYGYEMEFDRQGRAPGYRIDFEALAAQMVAIDSAARAQGVEIWRFIFAPDLRKFLLDTSYGDYIRKNIRFMKGQAWVRHDEHFHVDFDIPCGKI
jgi:penicillin-insensitive murein endopeptidase